ncbi:protein phosphatase 2C domain-containing protein [Streptomyces sp. ME02-8801-2C]|uniref:protein phosphatase 2C domain-containing protein n=1 Tax=Streptomyces sp. ME02-8801-2C TaxID=3028680 RepID=UPI0029BCAD3F|nr:protein phosphatase 2C domain-containing protein [Streptomyces sp. ME02-8801-2C]MDX3451179.1 protein phosphatase 2C domain-containing protein [Streptomyces sp. ME02-8801-2C]
MSQQGERSTGHEDDWWGQLYDDSTEDTGPTAAGDSLDDRFASASGTVDAAKADPVFGSPATAPARRGLGEGRTPEPPFEAPGAPGVPPQRGGAPYGTWDAARGSEPGSGRPRAPWEPPPAMPSGPATFPLGFRNNTPSPPPDDTRTPYPPTPPAPDRTPPSENPTGAPERPGGGAAPAPAHGGGGAAGPEASGPVDAAGAVWDAPPPSDVPPGIVSASARDGFSAAPSGDGPEAAPRSGWAGSPPGEQPRDAASGQDGPAALRTPTRRDIPAVPAHAPKDPGAPGYASSGIAVVAPPGAVDHVGSGPPTYAPEPTALPPADPDDLEDLVADTVLDGAQYGASTLRAVSLRGDSARFRGEPRRDSLLTARFGSGDHALVLIAMATGARATPGAHRAAAEACHWIGRAVGRSHVRLAEDLRAARRGDLKSGLHRLTDRSLGKLRASAAEQGIEPEEYTAGLRCLLLPADPDCRTRVFFGVGAGGLFRLRDGEWHDIEPRVAEIPAGEPVVGFGSSPHETPDGDRLTMDLGITTPPSPYEPAPEPPREPFRFRASVARPGDTLLLCTGGLADPLRGEPELCEYLADRWSGPTPPGLAAFLADTQVRVKGYADDRTAAAVWEA